MSLFDLLAGKHRRCHIVSVQGQLDDMALLIWDRMKGPIPIYHVAIGKPHSILFCLIGQTSLRDGAEKSDKGCRIRRICRRQPLGERVSDNSIAVPGYVEMHPNELLETLVGCKETEIPGIEEGYSRRD